MIVTALSLALASVTTTQPAVDSVAPNIAELTLPPADSPAPRSVQAIGPNISYSYLHIAKGWGNSDFFGEEIDADSLVFGASFELGDALFAAISLGNTEYDLFGFSVDTDVLTVGIGAHTALSDSVDFVGGFSLIQADQNYSLGGTTLAEGDGDGFQLSAGFRAMISAQLEFNAALSYVDIEDEDDNVISLGGVFGFTENLAATGSYSTTDDADVVSLGLRFYF